MGGGSAYVSDRHRSSVFSCQSFYTFGLWPHALYVVSLLAAARESIADSNEKGQVSFGLGVLISHRHLALTLMTLVRNKDGLICGRSCILRTRRSWSIGAWIGVVDPAHFPRWANFRCSVGLGSLQHCMISTTDRYIRDNSSQPLTQESISQYELTRVQGPSGRIVTISLCRRCYYTTGGSIRSKAFGTHTGAEYLPHGERTCRCISLNP